MEKIEGWIHLSRVLEVVVLNQKKFTIRKLQNVLSFDKVIAQCQHNEDHIVAIFLYSFL